MTQDEVEAFLTISECNSISAAAEKMFVSQPALSTRLSALEQELGMTLISRQKGRRRVVLTEAGKRFLPLAKKWQLLTAETHSFKNQDITQVCSIAAVNSVFNFVLPHACSSLSARDGLRLYLLSAHSSEVYKHVESGIADMGLLAHTQYSSLVRLTPLYNEKLCFVCGASSSYPELVNPRDLSVRHEVAMNWNERYSTWHSYWLGDCYDAHIYVDDISHMLSFLNCNENWAVVPESIALACGEDEIRICELTDSPEFRTIYMIVPVSLEPPPEFTILLQSIKQYVERFNVEWLLEDFDPLSWNHK